MKTKQIEYNGVNLTLEYKTLSDVAPEYETGFTGNIEYNELQRVLVNDVDITNVVGAFEFESLENELNK